jgi:tetratricopeptide (TPR) repeat protein
MKLRQVSVIALVVIFVFESIFVPADAGMFDDPKNLKALPEDITSAELRATMRGFAINTGSRCSDCHVYENERDLSTYDFSLDDKEKKRKARAMIRMVEDINSYLATNLDKPAGEMVKVHCGTCHRGQARPEMLQDVLAKTNGSEGLGEAISEYRALRERYYGSHTFDFSEGVLLNLGGRMAKAGDVKAALGFLELNLEFYPESARSYAVQGQVYERNGDVEAARSSFTKSLELDPGNEWTRKMLADLDAG